MTGVWVKAIVLFPLLGFLFACESNRSFERSIDGSTKYLDEMTEAEKVGAREAIVSGLRRGLDKYRLRVGDQIEVLFHLSEAPTTDEYVISVGDEIAIDFLYDPANNQAVRVRPDGRISLPLMGSVMAAGLTVDELASFVTEAYRGVLDRPVVTVNVSDFITPLDDFGEVIGSAPSGRSKTITVAPDGTIVLPLLPTIDVVGLPVEELVDLIDMAYSALSINIRVSVLPSAIKGDRIFVFGEVQDPGTQVSTQPKTVLMAVAGAGGVLTTASMRQVKVFYVTDDLQPKIRSVNLINVLENLELEQDMLLPNNSVVYVPPSELARATRLVDQVLRQLLLFNGTGFNLSYLLNPQGGGQIVTPVQ